MHYVRKVFPLSIELDNNRDTNLLSNMSVVYLLTLLKASKGGRGAGFTYWLLGESEHNFQQKTHSFNLYKYLINTIYYTLTLL